MRTISEAKAPAVKQEVYDAFFESPVWLGLKQAAIQRMDNAADIVFSSNDMSEIHRMRGVMHGLMFLIGGKENLMHLISDGMDAVAEVSTRLRTAITELEKENGRNNPDS